MVNKWQAREYRLYRELVELGERQQRGEITDDQWRTSNDELMRQHPANPLLERRHDLAIETVQRMRSVFTEDEIARMPLAVRLALTGW